MNRQVKRQMAKQGTDRPSSAAGKGGARPPQGPQHERTGPRQYLREVQLEMKRVAWPPRAEILNSTLIVIIGVIVMTALIFLFDYVSNSAVTRIFS
jgi:preprotein translocase subunit SecE